MAQAGHYFTRDVPMGDIQDAGSNLATMNGGKSIAKFYRSTVQDVALSASRGKWVGREIDMVRIIIPGDKHNIVERRVKEVDKQRYAKEYDAFRKMEDHVPDGTLLETWSMLSRAQVEDLKYNNVFTVEQLSDLPDNALSSLGIGARMLRQHAKAFLDTAKTGSVPAVLVAENEQLRQSVKTLQKHLDDLTKKFEVSQTKAGEDVSEMSDPAFEARVAVKTAMPEAPAVSVPEDYQTMSLPALKALCKEFSSAPVVTKRQAFELIEELLAQ